MISTETHVKGIPKRELAIQILLYALLDVLEYLSEIIPLITFPHIPQKTDIKHLAHENVILSDG